MLNWLDRLGYGNGESGADEALFGLGDDAASVGDRPYAAEIADMLSPTRGIAASYVYCVGEMPVVCFYDGRTDDAHSSTWLDDARRKLWNQGLVSVVIVLGEDELNAMSVLDPEQPIQRLSISEAFAAGAWSASDFRTGNVQTRTPSWFEPDRRIDRRLLANLTEAVAKLSTVGLQRIEAELLLAQVIFVRTLEERAIITDHYRKLHAIEPIANLIRRADGAGIGELLAELARTFNGDLLKNSGTLTRPWSALSTEQFELIDSFLAGENVLLQQPDFWGYDFSIIPVETISGIYESFLGDRRKDQAAYYTPRHLAVVAVEEAFRDFDKPHALRVFDGACGSGILLTTALQKMLASAETARGGPLPFKDRVALLSEHIFGGDIDPTACWLTAFSLYLCILDRLTPSDIALLQEDEGTLLPPLLAATPSRPPNICRGKDDGDMFQSDRASHRTVKFDVVLSNPPWKEVGGVARERYERWLEDNEPGVDVPDGQIAAAFTHCAAHRLSADGRMVLILPLNLLIGIDSHGFRQGVLERMRVERIYNFGDLRFVLFPAAKNACGVLVARPRPHIDGPVFGSDETVSYCTPKADLSLALGRITIQTADRAQIASAAIYSQAPILLHRYWGGRRDIDLLTRLVRHGTIREYVGGRVGEERDVGKLDSKSVESDQADFDFEVSDRIHLPNDQRVWHVGKGFHATDRNNKNYDVNDDRMQGLGARPFLKTKDLPLEHPFIADDLNLSRVRDEFRTVATPGGQQQKLYQGPRVIWRNGLSLKRRIRASYTERPFAFQHTACALGGEHADPQVARFITLYLRSSLATYLLIMNSYSVVADRWAVSKHEIVTLPFVPPEAHRHPEVVTSCFARSDQIFADLAEAHPDSRDEIFKSFDRKVDEIVAEYFGLSKSETEIVSDASTYTASAMQPRTYDDLLNALTGRPDRNEAARYARLLRSRLSHWGSSRGGDGEFLVEAVIGETKSAFGAVRVRYQRSGGGGETAVMSDGLAMKLLSEISDDFSRHAQRSIVVSMPDVSIAAGNDIFIVKPMQRRCWLSRAALDDADRLVADLDALAMLPSQPPLGRRRPA